LLRDLGAIGGDGRITEAGRRLRRLPLPPRLTRMVVDAAASEDGALAAEIAMLLSERGLGGTDVDLTARLDRWRVDASRRAREARALAKRWAHIASSARSPDAGSPASRTAPQAGRSAQRLTQQRRSSPASAGALLALAYPDRIAKRRDTAGAFLLANGRGANLDPASALAREPFLAVAEIGGTAAQGRIMLAAPLTLDEIEARLGAAIESHMETTFEAAGAGLRARRLRRLGAIVLDEQPLRVAHSEETARMLAQGITALGLDRLPWTRLLRQWRERVMFLRRAEGDDWPDLSDHALAARAADWLAPALAGKTDIFELGNGGFADALQSLLPWRLRRRLDAEAPTHFVAPSGSSLAIDYGAPDGPKLAVRVQELFGLDRHPAVAGGRVPLVLELLSPAHRPVQVTRDLAGFWRGSYAAVRAEMKGRYPRHPWPDDPLAAPPTRRTKPRDSI
jgi:ATP-dependent helicase HrpB